MHASHHASHHACVHLTMHVLQVKDTAAVLLMRYVSPLLLAAAAALVSPSHSLLAAVAAICALSPAPFAVSLSTSARVNKLPVLLQVQAAFSALI